jgi:hypothetical protein
VSTSQNEAGAYVPRPGERVTVRRYIQPTLTPGDPERKLTFQVTGTLTDVEIKGSAYRLSFGSPDLVVQYDDDGHREPAMFDVVFTGYTFLKPDYLVTEVMPAVDIPAWIEPLADRVRAVKLPMALLSDAMRRHGEDPGDNALWKVRIGQLDTLLFGAPLNRDTEVTP